MTSEEILTPSQTVGPFLHIAMGTDGEHEASAVDDGDLVTLTGSVLDGAGDPVVDALVELWQVEFDAAGDAERAAWARSATDGSGRYRIRTRRPGGRHDGHAPHLALSVFARGLLDRVVTRVYLPWEPEANAADPVLRSVPADRRATLIASGGPETLEFTIRLQGPDETVFFQV